MEISNRTDSGELETLVTYNIWNISLGRNTSGSIAIIGFILKSFQIRPAYWQPANFPWGSLFPHDHCCRGVFYLNININNHNIETLWRHWKILIFITGQPLVPKIIFKGTRPWGQTAPLIVRETMTARWPSRQQLPCQVGNGRQQLSCQVGNGRQQLQVGKKCLVSSFPIWSKIWNLSWSSSG